MAVGNVVRVVDFVSTDCELESWEDVSLRVSISVCVDVGVCCVWVMRSVAVWGSVFVWEEVGRVLEMEMVVVGRQSSPTSSAWIHVPWLDL